MGGVPGEERPWVRREAPWRGSLCPLFLALSHHWLGGGLGSKFLSLGTPEERLSSVPPSPAPNPAGGPRWRLRCRQEGEEGQSSVNVRRAEQLPGSGWGQGWRRERENGEGWGAGGLLCSYPIPIRDAAPVIIPETPEWPASLPCFMGEGKGIQTPLLVVGPWAAVG